MGVFSLLLVFTAQTWAFIPNDIFATKDERLFELFCVDTVEELEAVGRMTKTHDDITGLGLKRALIKFFTDQRPELNLDASSSLTLSAIYQLVYGKCASPLNFLESVKDISDANVFMDGPATALDPAFHFDSEKIAESQDLLISRYPKIIAAATQQQNYKSARQLLGRSLHAIQKFYSHTNWIEMGKNGTNEALGIPGTSLGEVAGESDDTCHGSDVITKKITSGFHNGTNATFPDGVEKCHHGGSLDSSNAGINKDTSSPCFSPGHQLHGSAADMATDATERYINHIRSIIGPGHFEQLFNLAKGSALAIVIDTTGSMDDEIQAVKEQVADIIDAAGKAGYKHIYVVYQTYLVLFSGASPSSYILVPFNDPGCGPATRTTDPSDFMDAVNSLEADGGDDPPEMFWCGLLKAISTAPLFSDIICFTDAVGKDGQLLASVKALSNEKHSKVAICLFITSSF